MVANNWVYRVKVESFSEPGKQYTVAEKRDGSWGCDCPAWKFHKAPKVDCKHIEAAKLERDPDLALVWKQERVERLVGKIRDERERERILTYSREAEARRVVTTKKGRFAILRFD